MFYLSFHGGSGGIDNIKSYADSGSYVQDVLVKPSKSSGVKLDELRGFSLAGNTLWVANGSKHTSQLLCFTANGDGTYSLASQDGIYASQSSVAALYHPFDFTFAGSAGQPPILVSSQDTNVVAALTGPDAPGPIAPYLTSTYGTDFLPGTVVASSQGTLGGTRYAMNIPCPPGLDVSTDSKGDPQNSVRGIALSTSPGGQQLYVSDEPGSAVRVYAYPSGAYQQSLSAGANGQPDHLLVSGSTLYIGVNSTASRSGWVLSYDLAGTSPPAMFIPPGTLQSAAGMAFDASGNFYVADRLGNAVYQFTGQVSQGTIIPGLEDNPEFLVYVPDPTEHLGRSR